MAKRRLLIARAEGAQVGKRRVAGGEVGLRLEHAMSGAQHLDRFRARREEVADVRSADQPQPLDRGRVDGREHLPDTAAERLAGDDRLVDPDLAEEEVEVVRILLRRILTIGPAAVTVTSLVESVDVKGRSQGSRRLLPHPAVAGGRV